MAYDKHCTITDESFVKENIENNTTTLNVLRTIDGIYLLTLDKIQVGYEIFYLHSHIVINKQTVIKIPNPK